MSGRAPPGALKPLPADRAFPSVTASVPSLLREWAGMGGWLRRAHIRPRAPCYLRPAQLAASRQRQGMAAHTRDGPEKCVRTLRHSPAHPLHMSRPRTAPHAQHASTERPRTTARTCAINAPVSQPVRGTKGRIGSTGKWEEDPARPLGLIRALTGPLAVSATDHRPPSVLHMGPDPTLHCLPHRNVWSGVHLCVYL